MAAYSVTRFDAIDEIDDGGAPYRPVRHHFGISSFGVNSFTGRKTGDRRTTSKSCTSCSRAAPPAAPSTAVHVG